MDSVSVYFDYGFHWGCDYMKVQILPDGTVLLKFLFIYLILMNLVWCLFSVFLLLLKKQTG